MKLLRTSMILAAALIVAVAVQQASAQSLEPHFANIGLLFGVGSPVLLGTTGACNNVNPGGPCTQKSTLVLLNAKTGKLIRTLGPVGFTVNGLAWDRTSGNLYASTAIGDVKFHGLITINPKKGTGTPVNPAAVNFGLAGGASPVHSIAIDPFGHMVGWYDEFPPPAGVTDTYVRINQLTGVATEFDNTGINTSQNGVAFGEFNLLWNIDSPKFNQVTGISTQTAYLLNPFNGTKLFSTLLTPPTPAALGAFHPGTNLYWGLNFDPFLPTTFIEVVDVLNGTVTELGRTVDNLHTLTFIP